MKNEQVLGHLREARAAMVEMNDEGEGSRALSVALTHTDTAILWAQENIRLSTPAVNEEERN